MNKINFLPPWVETNCQPAFYDVESGTVLQQVARMYAKVNQLVRTVNEQDEKIEEYVEKFIDLKEYVEDYFDNLDVQEEINNKLDQMAEDGVLQEIIGDYLNANAVWGFDNVADMKASTNLIEGSFAHTLGYYAKNDGGCATYKIRKVTNDDTVDDGFLIEVGDPANELVAELIIEDNKVNIRQLGAKSQIDSAKTDIAPYIAKYIAKLDELENRITLYIPSGVWYSTPLTIHYKDGFSIIGDEQFIHNVNGGTIISSLVDNQTSIWTIGNGLEMLGNYVLKNLCFTTADFTLSSGKYVLSTIKTIGDYCLRIQGCEFGDTDNLYFQHINGRGFEVATTWETRYRKLYFRDVNALGSSVMRIAPAVTAIQNNGVNASMFDNVMFEQVLGDLIECAKGCKFQNTTIGVINFEDYKINRTGVVYTTITDDNATSVESGATHMSIIKLPESGCQCHNININNLQLNNVACWYSTVSGQDYVYDTVAETVGAFNLFELIINNVDVLGINKKCALLRSKDNVDQGSAFIVNNIFNRTKNPLFFDIDNFTYIKCDERRFLSVGYQQRLNRSITPSYELVSNRTTGNRYLISDDGCVNALGVATKMASSSNPFRFTVAGSTIYVRAKIPNGETYSVSVTGSHTQTESLVGTGDFKIYEITLSNVWNIGDYIQFNPASGNTGTSMLIDYFIN